MDLIGHDWTQVGLSKLDWTQLDSSGLKWTQADSGGLKWTQVDQRQHQDNLRQVETTQNT